MMVSLPALPSIVSVDLPGIEPRGADGVVAVKALDGERVVTVGASIVTCSIVR
jgi:hypothetical protein